MTRLRQRATVLAFLLACGTNLWAWWNSDKAVLRQQQAIPVTEANGAELVALVRELADRAGLPMPAVYILPAEQPNAFATGRNPQNAAVAVSQGLLRTLDRDELAGVIAHELAHIRQRDTLTMTVTATLAGQIVMEGFIDLKLPAWLRRLVTRLVAIVPAIAAACCSPWRWAASASAAPNSPPWACSRRSPRGCCPR